MFDNEVTSVQITKRGLKLLGEIAEYFHRSKSKQLEWWVEQEHRRIFKDGEQSPVPAETDKLGQQA